VLRDPQLLEVRADRLAGDAGIAKRGDGRALGALRELLAVRAEDEAVVDVFRRLRAKGFVQSAVEPLVRPMVIAANDVRDPEVDVVHDAREVVGGRVVVAEESDASKRGPTRSAASRYRSGRSLCRTGPSSQSTPSQSRSSRIASSPPGTLRAGLVSSMRSRNQPPKRRFATVESAFPTCSEPVGLGANRTRRIGNER
jgi:hypothetical protein